jgi:hypothetical protein
VSYPSDRLTGGVRRDPAGTPAYVLKVRERLAHLPFYASPWSLLVTGSREAEAAIWGDVVADCLTEINVWLAHRVKIVGPIQKVLRHGGARGIDTIAHIRAPSFGYSRDRMPADWGHWGRRSGVIRNAAMVAKVPVPNLCLAFFASSSRGTADCAAQARNAGIPTVSITVEDLYLPHAY